MNRKMRLGCHGKDEAAHLDENAGLPYPDKTREGLIGDGGKGKVSEEPPAVDAGLVEMWMELRF